MEHKASLPCSQALTTRLYPEPDDSSQYTQTLFLRSNLILSSYLCLDLPSSLFSLCLISKILYAFLLIQTYLTTVIASL
jgi:hypothetical protein